VAQKTEAQKRAQKAYISKFVRVEVRMEQESQAAIKAHATARGESVNAFIVRAIREAMERDQAQSSES
jgi:predicted HicB family RNase H-like nuclease